MRIRDWLFNTRGQLLDLTLLLPPFSFKDESMVPADFFRNLGFNGLIRGDENLQFDKVLHNFKRLQPHLFCQRTDNNRRLDADGVSFNNPGIGSNPDLFSGPSRIDRSRKINVLFFRRPRYPWKPFLLHVFRFLLPVLDALWIWSRIWN